jgi:hypothetical protein
MSARRGRCGFATVPFARASDRVLLRLAANGGGVTGWRGGPVVGQSSAVGVPAPIVVDAEAGWRGIRTPLSNYPPRCRSGLRGGGGATSAPARAVVGRVLPRRGAAGYENGACPLGAGLRGRSVVRGPWRRGCERGGAHDPRANRVRRRIGSSCGWRVPFNSPPDMSARAAIRSRRSS